LTVHAREFYIDLLHTQKDEWKGRFHRKGFDSHVALTRPGKTGSKKGSWPTGTWNRAGWGPNCLHIAETEKRQFVGWSDTLVAWGAIRSAPDIQKPPYSLEHYGDLAKISTFKNGVLSIELNAYTAICCSQLFSAASAKNGTLMIVNEGARRIEWKKMPGDSCLVNK